jgi:exopolyphosphatase / guanosine-5'-triphosphate,3'-diphosphate pyrophosphatase
MEYELIAAVDLGSNSFRLQVGRVVGDQVYPLDNLKDTVRLAAGLQPDKTLDNASQIRALAALRQFGERLRGFHPHAVRAVATNALRVAKNAAVFLREAEQALGFPIEVIAGREEARLIYLGVSHSLPAVRHKRLVVDIGGGSTEFIIGRRVDPLLMESLYMGCVGYSVKYFPNGVVDKKAFREAEVAAGRELENISHEYLAFGWKEAIGSSGSAREIADILEQNDLNPPGVFGITRVGLDKLRSALIKAGRVDQMGLQGVRGERLAVLPGGVAIMSAVFDSLQIERMSYGDGALRLGVLYDLLGRFHHHDMRDTTVAHFMQRYQVDPAQAKRVESLAVTIFGQLYADGSEDFSDQLRFLTWAARLHEIGISIAHSAYHKHGAYILTFADMPGFSKKDQGRLAFLVLGHRGKLERLASLPLTDPGWCALFSLRFAALFNRSRHDTDSPQVRAKRLDNGFQLDLPLGWLPANTMTASVLVDEVEAWRRVGLELKIRSKYVDKTEE